MKKATKQKKVTESPSDLIRSTEAALLIGQSAKTLRNWRTMQREDQPPYYRMPAVRYSKAAVLAWLAKHAVGVQSESQAS